MALVLSIEKVSRLNRIDIKRFLFYFFSMDLSDRVASKLFFKIGELAQITGISVTKIRYWTKNYQELNKQVRISEKTKQKLYHKDSIKIIQEINKYLKNLDILASKDRINQKLRNNLNSELETMKRLEKLKERLRSLVNISPKTP
jgi:DNA-binding transcriptional MerR regulator